MVTQESVSTQVKESKWDFIRVFLLDIVLPMSFVAVIGAGLAAGFWGIWYAVAGSIPKFLGFSRFWLDTISFAFYLPVIVLYVFSVLDELDELSAAGNYKVFLWEFVDDCLAHSLVGLFLIIDFVASIFFSFATGLAGIAALAFVILLGYLLRKAIVKLVVLFFSWLAYDIVNTSSEED